MILKKIILPFHERIIGIQEPASKELAVKIQPEVLETSVVITCWEVFENPMDEDWTGKS